ncbi:MAG: mechanosensitive ion channel family protein, partial [Bacteroidia bacterium]|nr:mechanosensitive ion channel family protein [Bacteroidia bacterium]
MDNFWDKLILNNTIRDWTISLSIIVVTIIILRLIQTIVIRRLKVYAEGTKTNIDDFIIIMIQSSVMPLLYLLTIYFALKYIKISSTAEQIMHVAILLIVTFFVLRAITSFIGFTFKEALKRKEKNAQREKQARGILLIIQVIIWATGFLFLIDNLGYDITTLVAGLGIGGIAIALAAQAILGDLFSYLVIFFDKPFEIGDFIVLDDKMGTVEYIGIKTTRLKTLSGEQLICSNTDLTNSRVHNYKRMQERRILFSFGVVYNTDATKLKAIPEQVKQIIDTTSDTRFDRAHFKSFGDFSLDFEVVYFILSPEYNTYMDKQQSINMRIFELFEKEQVEFAFPTQTIFLNKTIE